MERGPSYPRRRYFEPDSVLGCKSYFRTAVHKLCISNILQDSERVYPLLFKVAFDVLPVQVSAVSCERVFSSTGSRETYVLRQSLLSAAMLEVLQVLKHLFKQDRLNFTTDWIAHEDDYSIESPTEAAIHELVASAKLKSCWICYEAWTALISRFSNSFIHTL